MKTEYLRFSKERRDAQMDYSGTLDCVREAERKDGERAWAIYDSSLDFCEDNFAQDFNHVVPDNMILRGFILEEFANKRGELVGLELGGPGSRLFADFPKDFFRLTAGVTLVDLRTEKKKYADQYRNHHVIEFDISSPLLGRELKDRLGIPKAHLIIERMNGGLPDHFTNPYFLYQVGNQWYQLLETPGVMFVQCPRFIHKIMSAWESKVNSFSSGAVEASYFRYGTEKGVLRVSKKDGAPDNLPFLTPRELRSAFAA